LRGAASARAEAGFRLRWAEHQARDAGRRGREREWGLLAAAAAAVLGLVALSLGIYLFAGGSLAVLFAAGLQQVVRWALWLRVVGEIGRAIVWNLPLLSVSGYALSLTALITATGLMIVTWSTTIRRFSPKGAWQ
jgi:hypothetical protein